MGAPELLIIGIFLVAVSFVVRLIGRMRRAPTAAPPTTQASGKSRLTVVAEIIGIVGGLASIAGFLATIA
ncbi:MAG: hypothetical protein AAGA93_17970 [Actinomycetota bacterium]